MSSLLKIQKAAFELFAQKGYEATTLNDIATHVGIKKPSLYVYYSSKEDLFLAVVEDLLLEYQEGMNELLTEVKNAEGEHQLQLLFEKYILWFAQQPEKSTLWNRVFLFPPPELREKMISRILSIEAIYLKEEASIIEDLINKGIIRDVSQEDITLSFRSYRSGLLMAFLINQELDKSKIKIAWKCFWDGIGMKE